MRRYIVRCTAERCRQPAVYKIAAEWNDGTIEELKTYGLACEQHLENLFRVSCQKQQGCRLAEGETLSPPRIFSIKPGRRDRQLERLTDFESKFH